MTIRRFEDLTCWQKARNLVGATYEAVRADVNFQRDLRLAGQITGAAVSIMNNIAEGWASQSNREFIRFLTYSRRSASELQNCLYVALDQEYVLKNAFDELYDQAQQTIKVIDGLLRYLRHHETTKKQKAKKTR
ncbi:MAG: four helix bundle protein [Desulfobacterales bacterium]